MQKKRKEKKSNLSETSNAIIVEPRVRGIITSGPNQKKKTEREREKKKEDEVAFHSDERRIGDVTREQTTLKLQNTANCFLLADIHNREENRRGRSVLDSPSKPFTRVETE